MPELRRRYEGKTEMSTRQIVGMVMLAVFGVLPMMLGALYCIYLMIKEKRWTLLIRIFWIIGLFVGICLLLI